MIRQAILLVVAALLLSTAQAQAFDFEFPWIDKPSSFEITNTLIFDFHDQNHNGNDLDDDYYDLQNRLNLKLAVDRFTMATRLDFIGFMDTPDTGDDPGYVNRINLEKLSARYGGKNLKVVVGDFYASLGRGLALTIRKTDQLGEDNTLQGAKLSFRHSGFKITTLAGLLNPSNTDLYEKTIKDSYDLITGLESSYLILDTARLGIQGVGIKFDPLDRNDKAVPGGVVPDYASVLGTSLDLADIADLASFYAEFNWLGSMPRSTEFVPAERHDGYAAYMNASLFAGDWTIVGEFKYYDEYQLLTWTPGKDDPPSSWGNWFRPMYDRDLRYNDQRLDLIRPPTLEPAQMEVGNNWDVYGGRLQVDLRPGGADTLLFVAYSSFVETDWGFTGPAGKRRTHNGQVGVEQDFLSSGRFRLALGYRHEYAAYEGEVPEKQLFYQNLSLKMPLTRRHSLDFHGNNWVLWEKNPDLNFLKGEWSLGYTWSPWLAASVLFGYDTSPSGRYRLQTFYNDPNSSQARRQLFLAGSVSATLWHDYIIKVRAGQIRGGLICVDGACKIVPPSAGVRAELTTRF